jgi:hypothetical protein
MPISGLALAGGLLFGTTAASVVNSNKARKETRKANKIQERVRQTQDARARLAQVRQARISQAEILQSGATQGATGSSAVQGGFSAAGSNANNNIQFINQIDILQQAVNKRMENANSYSAKAQEFSQLSSLAASIPTGKK